MRTTLFAVVALATGLSAQSFYVPTNTPNTGTCNAFPFATTDMRYQALIRASELNNTPALITGFGLAPCATGVRTLSHVTMKMAHLAAATLSTTFDSNLAAGATTVLDAPNYKWNMTVDVWNDIDLQQPFVYNGVDNLVVEFLVIGSSGAGGTTHRDATNQRVYLGNYTGQLTGTDGGLSAFKMRVILGDATAWTFGSGCAGSNTLVPTLTFAGDSKLSSKLAIQQSNALATMPTVLDVGQTTAGPLFPFDLTPIGAPGCVLYTDALISVPMVTSSTGTSSLSLPVPNDPALVGFKLYFQWANLDSAANKLGVTTSNYGRVLFGN